ncbi:hypothetical protein OSB04_023064 [Centaurea solstitialis]|uniref:Uncharacterized protein n=1 Tax=Centaurea solstitialis TaxID=347529 RepID=A0AA38T1Y5_9ASTR|nr:hypothetical protein OSB04_023064 [Centaurea solstitialis]
MLLEEELEVVMKSILTGTTLVPVVNTIVNEMVPKRYQVERHPLADWYVIGMDKDGMIVKNDVTAEVTADKDGMGSRGSRVVSRIAKILLMNPTSLLFTAIWDWKEFMARARRTDRRTCRDDNTKKIHIWMQL